MKCPKCNYKQYCPCDSCKDILPDGKKVWINLGSDVIKCGNCGFSAHCDWWEMESGRQHDGI